MFLNCYRFFGPSFSCDKSHWPVRTLILIEHSLLNFSFLLVRHMITSWVKAFFPPTLQVQCGGGGRLWWSGPRRQRLEDHTHWRLQVSPLQKPAMCCVGSGGSVPHSCHRWAFILKCTQTQQHTAEHGPLNSKIVSGTDIVLFDNWAGLFSEQHWPVATVLDTRVISTDFRCMSLMTNGSSLR